MRYFLFLCVLCHIAFGWGIKEAESRELVIGTSTGYPPYYFSQKGKLVGVCIETINQIAKELGLSVIYRQFPWNRMLFNARTGKVDAIMPLFKTEKREAFLIFPDQSLAIEENSFFTWKQSELKYKGDFRSLTPYKIGVVTNYSYGKAFDKIDFFIKEFAIDDHSLVMKFKLKRFDIGIGSEYVINYHAKDLKISQDIIFLKPSVTRDPLYIGFSKEKVGINFVNQFNQALTKLKTSQRYQEILKHYGVK